MTSPVPGHATEVGLPPTITGTLEGWLCAANALTAAEINKQGSTAAGRMGWSFIMLTSRAAGPFAPPKRLRVEKVPAPRQRRLLLPDFEGVLP